MLDERKLWKKICAGDSQAFDAWYRETAPRMRILLRHLLGNPQAVEDVMQDIYTHIWRRPQGFDPDRGSLRAWLYGVARKQAAEWWRKQKPTDPLELENAVPGRAEASSVMADLLGQLPVEQRSLLWLREVEGQSYAELAAILDIPIGTVRSRLFAAREALRVIWHSAPQGVPHDLH
ncbi:MAG: RNA polymerase sigma factor [Terracidiphilus sp.]